MLAQLFNLAAAPLEASHAFLKRTFPMILQGLWERWKVPSSAWLLLKLHLSRVCSETIFSSSSVSRAELLTRVFTEAGVEGRSQERKSKPAPLGSKLTF